MSALAAGFADPVFDSQRVFRAVMAAMAEPGAVVAVEGVDDAPHPLSPVAAAIALTLLDFETPVWLAPCFGAVVRDYLRFHAGAPAAEPDGAAFAFAGADPPEFEAFALGTDEYPDRSTTLVLDVAGFGRGHALSLSGPGVAGTRELAVEGLPSDIVERLAANRALFPRGVDLVLAGPGAVAALPRTTRVEEA